MKVNLNGIKNFLKKGFTSISDSFKAFVKKVNLGFTALNNAFKNATFSIKEAFITVNGKFLHVFHKYIVNGAWANVKAVLNLPKLTNQAFELLETWRRQLPQYQYQKLVSNKNKLVENIGGALDGNFKTEKAVKDAAKSSKKSSTFLATAGKIFGKGLLYATLLGGVVVGGIFIHDAIQRQKAMTGCLYSKKLSNVTKTYKIVPCSCCSNDAPKGSGINFTFTHPVDGISCTEEKCKRRNEKNCCIHCDATVVDDESLDYFGYQNIQENEILECKRATFLDGSVDLIGEKFNEMLNKMFGFDFKEIFKWVLYIALAIAAAYIASILFQKK